MAIGQLTHLASTVTLSTNSSASATVPNDGSVVAGDILLAACVMPSGSRTFSISGGAGAWTSLGTATQSGHMSQMWWRTAAAGDLGASITVTPSTGNIRQVLLLGKISGAAPQNPVSASSNTSAASTTKTTPSLGSVLANSRELSVVFDTRGASTPQTAAWTAPSGETERAEAFTTSGSGACSGAWGDSDTTVSGTIGSRIWTADQSALGSAWTLAIAQGDQSASPTRLESTATLYSPTTSSVVTAAPAAITSTATVYAPALTPGPVTSSPALLDPATIVYGPTASPGTATLNPSLLDSTTNLHTPSLTPGPVTTSPALLAGTSVVYTATAEPGTATLAPGRIDSSASLPQPAITPGPVTLTPARLESATSIHQPQARVFEPDITITLGQPATRWEVGTPWL